VTFALDRGGLVGSDGPTHHGVFDLSFLRQLPNMTVMAPRDEQELRRAMVTALTHEGPFAFRYPRGRGPGAPLVDPVLPLEIGRGERLTEGADGTLLAIGSMVNAALEAARLLEAEGFSLGVIDLRFAKPLDSALILAAARKDKPLITLEENVLAGGVGSAVLELLAGQGVSRPVLCLGLPDVFFEQGTQAELRTGCCLDAPGIAESVKNWLGGRA